MEIAKSKKATGLPGLDYAAAEAGLKPVLKPGLVYD